MQRRIIRTRSAGDAAADRSGILADQSMPDAGLGTPTDHLDTHEVPVHPQTLDSLEAPSHVEITDPRSKRRLRAVVESAGGPGFILRLERAATLPDTAPVRWFDGEHAWQATAQLEQLDAISVRCLLGPPETWQPSPVRRSERTQMGNRLVVRIVSSTTIPGGRRVHAECLEASATGCRTTWPGQAPRKGDAVDLTWDSTRPASATDLGWIPARVARVIQLPEGAHEVCFSFDTMNSMQAARVRSWHRAWLQRHQVAVTHDDWI